MATGLLADEEVERIERHFGECTSCFTHWQMQAGSPPLARTADAHIAAALLADWERQQRTLRGLERASVRHHLLRCEDCRRDLAALGHNAVLERIPALELEGAFPEPALSSRRARDPQAGPRPIGLAWVPWAWAGVATAAALALTTVLIVSPRSPAGSGVLPGFDAGRAAPTAPEQNRVRLESGMAAMLTPVTESARPARIAFNRLEPTRSIVLVLLDPPAVLRAQARLELWRDGLPLARLEFRSPDPGSVLTLTLRGRATRLTAGHYELRTVDEPRETLYAFEGVTED
jgi:hypothetical protein